MIGKLITRCITLDYTTVARPIDVDAIIDDIRAARSSMGSEPEKIVMWEHQLDWIKKCAPGRYGMGYTWECIEHSTSRSKYSPTLIWGIPVTVEK